MSIGSDYALHAASKLLCFDFDELPEALLNVLLDHLRHVKHENKGTLDNIDYGLVKLLSRKDPSKGIEFIEALLLDESNSISMDLFDSVSRQIYKDEKLLKKLLTRWFFRGDRVLCMGISEIVNKAHGLDLLLEVDPSELVSKDFVHIVFLVRKTVGYLFFKPVTAASILISLLHHNTDDKVLQQMNDLLFDPLLLNYPGKVRDFLLQQVEKESGKTKLVIETALKAFDKYLDDLKSTGEIIELHPSQAQREAYRRHFSRLMHESLKEAEKKSVLANLFSKSVLLYGRKSINYIYGPDGKSNRMEIPLQCHGTEMEFPRYEYIDPFGLDYMLRLFQVEKIRRT